MRAGGKRRGRDRNGCVKSGTTAAEMVGPLAPVAITLTHPPGQLRRPARTGPAARAAADARVVPTNPPESRAEANGNGHSV